MDNNIDDILYKWINKFEIRKDNIVPLSYLHLDPKLISRFKFNKNKNSIENNIILKEYLIKFYHFKCTPVKIKNHCFLPLIKINKPKFKYIKNLKTGKRKLHKYNEKTIDTATRVLRTRPIMYSSHTDSLIYSFFATLLEIKYEEWIMRNDLNDVVIGYRKINIEPEVSDKGKSSIDHAINVFDEINKRFNEKNENISAICIDISGFFDNLNHDILINNTKEVFNRDEFLNSGFDKVLNSITKYSYISNDYLLKSIYQLRNSRFKKRLTLKDRKNISKNSNKKEVCLCSMDEFNKIKRNEKNGNKQKNQFDEPVKSIKLINSNSEIFGIPQGTSISGLLANVYMKDFDLRVNYFAKQNNAIYKRYSDDIIIICPTELKESFIEKMKYEISTIKLEIKSSKTNISDFNNFSEINELSYLGLNYNGVKITIRGGTLSKYYSRLLNYKNYKKKKSINKEVPRGLVFKKFGLSKNQLTFISYAKLVYKKTNSKHVLKQIKKYKKILKK